MYIMNSFHSRSRFVTIVKLSGENKRTGGWQLLVFEWNLSPDFPARPCVNQHEMWVFNIFSDYLNEAKLAAFVVN